jgi:hypothetical protein
LRILQGHQHACCTHRIMNVCGMDTDIKKHPQTIYQDVPFASFNLFSTINTRDT